MEKEKINSAISEYIRKNLSPKEWEKKMISDRYDEICKLLVGNEIFQSGSFARFTSTTPVSDLDIIWVIPRSIIDEKLRTFGLSENTINPRNLKLSDILADLSLKLKDEYAKIGQKIHTKPQTHSVGVYFGDENAFSIDIVPAVKCGKQNEFGDDIYIVPEDINNEVTWVKSDPRGYIKEASKLNEKNDTFRKATKFIKKWKHGIKKENDLFPLKSFHLESISKDIITNNDGIAVYDSLVTFYSELDFYISEPKFKDRANDSVFIDDYVTDLSEEEIELVTKSRNQALDYLEAMKNCKSDSEIIQLVEELLCVKESISRNINSVFEYALSYLIQPPSWQKPLPWPKVTPQKIGIRCFLDGKKEIESKSLQFPNHGLKFISEYSGTYDNIYWQVVNTGEQAMSIGEYALRGNYFKAKDLNNNLSENPCVNWEQTAYHGNHWIYCFATYNGNCVAASDPFFINIFNKRYRGGYRRLKRR